jgi:hypothetical protein
VLNARADLGAGGTANNNSSTWLIALAVGTLVLCRRVSVDTALVRACRRCFAAVRGGGCWCCWRALEEAETAATRAVKQLLCVRIGG